jgi:hypothetical protein
MTDGNEDVTGNAERIEEDVEAAVGGGSADVREEVRRITLEALRDRRLDTEGVKRVMQAVVDGARRGSSDLGGQGRQKLSEAISGLDDALAAAAEATDLAVREAVGRGREFSRKELERTLDGLSSLETMFVDTLRSAARSASGFAADTLNDLAEHARGSGTSVGSRVNASLSQLRKAVSEMASARLEAGAETLRSGGAALADVAAGFLAGIADRLRKEQPKHTDDDASQPRE